MRERRPVKVVLKLLEDMVSNEKLLDVISEDLRKISLLLIAAGAVGFFAGQDSRNIKITATEAWWLTGVGVLIYLLPIAIMTLNSEKQDNQGR